MNARPTLEHNGENTVTIEAPIEKDVFEVVPATIVLACGSEKTNLEKSNSPAHAISRPGVD
jgi:hypothetical protein